jgi:hypothetical protein
MMASEPMPTMLRRPRPLPPDLAWGWWPAFTLAIAAGLWLVALGMGASRISDPAAEPLYWGGMGLIFVPAAVRLASPRPSRRERIVLLLSIGLALGLVKLLHSPLMFTFYDELLHWRTAGDILEQQRLFGANALLPVSPDYPGLESLVAALAQLLGWGLFPAALTALAAARLVFVLALYLFYEQAGRSRRLAALATLIYMANPAFVYFDSQFSYESLALPLAATALWAELRRQQAAGPAWRWRVVAVLATAGVIVTHHITSYVLVALLALWTLVALVGRRWGLRGPGPAWLAAVALVGVLAWLLVVARVTIGYLGGNFAGTLAEILDLIAGEAEVRQLFHGTAGDVAPLWERLAGYASVGLIMAALPAGLWAIWRRRRTHVLRLALAVGALAYPAGQLLRFTPFGLQIAGRLPAFVFIPLAYVLAYGLSTYLLTDWPRPRRLLACGAWLAMVFVGSVILGWPRWERMPGPYLLVADARSVDRQSIAAARWLGQTLPPNQRVVADRVNGLLALALGRQHVVSDSFEGIPVSELYFAEEWGAESEWIVREGRIRYLISDRRLMDGPPLAGMYFEPQERALEEITVPVGGPLRQALDELPGVNRVLDGGDIRIYDLGVFLDE